MKERQTISWHQSTLIKSRHTHTCHRQREDITARLHPHLYKCGRDLWCIRSHNVDLEIHRPVDHYDKTQQKERDRKQPKRACAAGTKLTFTVIVSDHKRDHVLTLKGKRTNWIHKFLCIISICSLDHIVSTALCLKGNINKVEFILVAVLFVGVVWKSECTDVDKAYWNKKPQISILTKI